MKVYLDDERPAPSGWVAVRKPKQAIELLKTGQVEQLSLDHDLGSVKHTGYDVLAWIEEAVFTRGFVPPPVIRVHSANPEGRRRMELAIQSIERFHRRNEEGAPSGAPR